MLNTRQCKCSSELLNSFKTVKLQENVHIDNFLGEKSFVNVLCLLLGCWLLLEHAVTRQYTIRRMQHCSPDLASSMQHAACSMHQVQSPRTSRTRRHKPPDKRSEANVRINISQAVPQTLEPSGGLILGIVTLLNIAELVLGG